MTAFMVIYIITLVFALLGSLNISLVSGNKVRDLVTWVLLVLVPGTNLGLAFIGVGSIMVWVSAVFILLDTACHGLGVMILRAVVTLLPHTDKDEDTNA